jgi:hypothetical protein
MNYKLFKVGYEVLAAEDRNVYYLEVSEPGSIEVLSIHFPGRSD